MSESVVTTEQRLVESALTLFSQKGYSGASIREIIDAAGVTRPVLYYYFENKEHLFRKVVESRFSDFLTEMDAAMAGVHGVRGRLQAVIQSAFIHTEMYPDEIRLILNVFFAAPGQNPEINILALWERRFRRIVNVLRDGMEHGEIKVAEPEQVAMAFCGVMDMHIMARVNRAGVKLTRELGDKLLDLFLAGAALQKMEQDFSEMT